MARNGRRDYYEVLGVARDASPSAIKEAFRRLAFTHHPDHSTAPDAEERFTEIAEAYAVLSDPRRRREYDASGVGGLAASPEDLLGRLDLGDLLGDLGLGGALVGRLFGFSRRGRGPAGGRDVVVEVEIPLEAVARGVDQPVRFRRTVVCPTCHGTGAAPGTEARACPVCQGSGQVERASRRGDVVVRSVSACDACHGTGQLVEHPCGDCAGRGQVAREEMVTVRIPPGVEEGGVLRVAGAGQSSPQAGGVAGDLRVVVHSAPHPDLARRGADLWQVVPISLSDAVLGTEVSVPTLDGPVSARIPPGVEPGAVLRIAGKGLPMLHRHGKGDLYLTTAFVVPKELSADQRALYEQLRALEPGASAPAHPRRRRSRHARSSP